MSKKKCTFCGAVATHVSKARDGETFKDLVGACADDMDRLSDPVKVGPARRFLARLEKRKALAWPRIVDLRPDCKAPRPSMTKSDVPVVSFSCRLVTA